MVTRSFLLPLLAVVAIAAPRAGVADATAVEQVSVSRLSDADKTRLGFVHAVSGAQRVDLVADGKTLKRNVKYGRPVKAKTLRAEGYSLNVDASKIGLPYIDSFTTDLQGGHDYTLVAFGDTQSTTPTAPLLVDLVSALIPKDTVQVVFANAAFDSEPAELLIDDQPLLGAVAAGQFSAPVLVNASKHKIEVRINGVTVISSSTDKLKGGRTVTYVLYGTAEPNDGNPLKLISTETKSR